MRTLRLEKYGKVYINGQLADTSKLDERSEFIRAIMLLDVELGEDVIVGDIIHFFYEAQDVIQSFFSEEYEVVRALVSSTRLPRSYKRLEVFKKLKMEKDSIEEGADEFLYFLPEIEFVQAEEGEDGVAVISALPIVINEDVSFKRNGREIIKSKTKITLYDLMVCLFEEIPASIKEGIIISS